MLEIQPITICLPIYIDLGKKKKNTFSLNLNTYRNAHFQILNKAKSLFEELVSKRIDHLPRMEKVELTYSLFFGSGRAIDIANICCVVDKFFCDTLVSNGKLPDDNMEVISKIAYQWGAVDRQNPRVEVTLSNIEAEAVQEKEEPMQIILNQNEIEEAIRASLFNQISLRENQEITIDFKATRGEEGITASIAIQPASSMTAVSGTQAAEESKQPRHGVKAQSSTKLVKEAPETSEPTEAKPEISVNPEDRREPSEMPATKVVGEEKGHVQPSEPVEKKQEKQEKPAIFPNAASSAPDPANQGSAPAAAKSLFANLTKPVHDPKPEDAAKAS